MARPVLVSTPAGVGRLQNVDGSGAALVVLDEDAGRVAWFGSGDWSVIGPSLSSNAVIRAARATGVALVAALAAGFVTGVVLGLRRRT